VRGDSLRDLYAKTLALLGLALLAGVGALVDYWPSGAFPAVQSSTPMAPRGLPALAALQADARAVVSSPPQVLKTAAQAVAPRNARTKTDRPAHSLEPLPVTVATAPADAELVSLTEPPLSTVVVPVVATRAPAPEVPLPAAPDFALSFGPDPPDAPLVDTSPDGFFGNATTAFRKTGESIVSTTVKTGSSIIKAFGFVGGAFKKVI
jgi:hypothetical protein